MNLIYQINTKVIETILTNKSAALCQSKKTELLRTNKQNYKLGSLDIMTKNGELYNLPKKMKLKFNPEGNLMSQLSKLTKNTAKEWYKEYLKYHKGVDQGINYLIGYFPETKRKMLRKTLFNQ